MDPHDPSSQPPPPGREEPSPEGQADGDEARASGRDRGLRHVRRLSNWTAVALVAATAVTAGYFARVQASAQHASTATGAQSQQSQQSQQSSAGPGQPCVTAPVAVSGGSGVAGRVPAPAQTCAPGTGGGTSPTAVTAQPQDREED